MARPRVFVSSTFYDLKHVRASLDDFIDSLGFDSVLSEKGDIPYSPEAPLDESCYKEVQNADIFVLIIGGRYGAAASANDAKPEGNFFEHYDSITRKEYEAAARMDVPIYILIESGVFSEYRTYLQNRDNTEIRYAHVDSANVFRLIESILSKSRNNPVQPFDNFGDVKAWLREQWAGLFRDLLHRKSNQQQLAELSSEVNRLSAVNETLKKYMETMITKISPDEGKRVIKEEQRRLSIVELLDSLRKCSFFRHTLGRFEDDTRVLVAFQEALASSENYPDFVRKFGDMDPIWGGLVAGCEGSEKALADFEEAFHLARIPIIS
jgi:hypothetical protein